MYKETNFVIINQTAYSEIGQWNYLVSIFIINLRCRLLILEWHF